MRGSTDGSLRLHPLTRVVVPVVLTVLLGVELLALAPAHAAAAPGDSVRPSAAGASAAVVSTRRVGRAERAEMVNLKRPRIRGTRRFGNRLRATKGRWSTEPTKVRYQWFRGKRKIRGADNKRYRIRPRDVGHRLSVRVRATARGYEVGQRRSARERIRHRVPVRRKVTYRVITRGRITTNVRVFRRQAAQTFAHAKGWRGAGVRFRRVARGGSFILVLASAARMTSFSSGCSAQWSCRVGRYVIINQERWKHASRAWNRAGRSRRSYRHMVVNHETGHWLGLGHRSCPGRGKRAPVMMQQSKGRAGCRLNPWPKAPERRAAQTRPLPVPGGDGTDVE